MNPDVLYLILCDDVRSGATNLHRLDVFGVALSVRSKATPRFPATVSLLKAFVALTNCQGVGVLSLRIVQAGTGTTVYQGKPRNVRFAGAPDDVVGLVFQIKNCSFPAAGVYWTELTYSGAVIARQRLLLKG